VASTSRGLLFVLVVLGVVSGCGTVSAPSRLESLATPAEMTSVTPPSSDVAPASPVEVVVTPSTETELAAAETTADETARPETSDSATITDDDRFALIAAMLAQTAAAAAADDAIEEEFDPWERFNEKTFEFNRRLDRYVLKPVAKVYDKIVPDRIQNMIANGFDNIRFVPRFVNSVLQAKWGGAGREIGRFLINSTLGIGGLFDIAKQEFGLDKSREDFGQTLGVWGAGPGPYLILPVLPPLTVRDAVGFAVDGAMNPLNYFLPFLDRFVMQIGDTVNDRSLNLELYQGFEETVIDMYSAVRHGYLQRRVQMIKE